MFPLECPPQVISKGKKGKTRIVWFKLPGVTFRFVTPLNNLLLDVYLTNPLVDFIFFLHPLCLQIFKLIRDQFNFNFFVFQYYTQNMSLWLKLLVKSGSYGIWCVMKNENL